MSLNQDQFLSLLRTVLKVGGAALVTHGLTSASTWQDVTGLIVGIAGLVWSHYYHGDDKTNPPTTS